VHTLQIEKRYVTFLPLRNKRNEIQGYLNLEFGRDQINSQLQTMALGNLRVLGIIIAASVLVLILLLSLGIVRPIERRLRAFFDQDGDGTQGTPETLNCNERDRDELSRIAVDVKCLLADSSRELQAFQGEQGSRAELLETLRELKQLNESLLSEADDADRRQQLSTLCTELAETIHRALGEKLPAQAGKAV
jgi:flagellar biosynthesis/type III secretory pathway M-ring protein FliF/YscJ